MQESWSKSNSREMILAETALESVIFGSVWPGKEK